MLKRMVTILALTAAFMVAPRLLAYSFNYTYDAHGTPGHARLYHIYPDAHGTPPPTAAYPRLDEDGIAYAYDAHGTPGHARLYHIYPDAHGIPPPTAAYPRLGGNGTAYAYDAHGTPGHARLYHIYPDAHGTPPPTAAYPRLGGNGTAYAYDAHGTPGHARLYHIYPDAIPSAKTVTSHSTTQYRLLFRFQTKYYDPETGLYYYGLRWYDPATCKWLSRDPIGEQGGVNLYAMCSNDAVNGWDYLGMYGDGTQAWSKTRDDIYCAQKDGATLEDLIRKVNQDYGLRLNPEEDWKALWIYNTARVRREHYPDNLKAGALFDASSLTPKELGYNKLVLSFYNPSERYKYTFFSMQGIGMPFHVKSGEWAYKKVRDQAQRGANPISSFHLIGHGGGANSIGGRIKTKEGYINDLKKRFYIDKFLKYAEGEYSGISYENAKNRIGPPRSWFAVNANARFWACISNSFARNFAAQILRKDATAYGTNSLQHWNSGTHPGQISYHINGQQVWFKNANAAMAAQGVWTKANGGL